MQIHAIRLLITFFISFLLLACGDPGPKMDLVVDATLNGKPISHAKVTLDGKPMGETGENGQLATSTNQIPGKQVAIEVTANISGADVQPWKDEFTVKLPKQGQVEKYSFQAKLTLAPYMEFTVQEKGVPLSGAVIKGGGVDIGTSNDKGKFIYNIDPKSKKAINFDVSKNGYSSWHQSVVPEAGKKFDIALIKRVTVTVEAREEAYGRVVGVAGVTVSIDGKSVGQTNAGGVLKYSYDGVARQKAQITYQAPTGYLPLELSVTEPMTGDAPLQHFFYPAAPKPIKVAIYRFVGNTPGVDLKEVLTQTQTALRAQLFKHTMFREVPEETLASGIKQEKLNIARISSKGWQGTKLQQAVDMIVLGSVAQDDKGYYIEVKFHSASGKLVFSQIVRASSSGSVNGAVKDIVENVIERFPFEATVIAKKDDRYEINVGDGYAISRSTEFEVMAPAAKDGARTAGARLVVKRVGDTSSMAEVGDNKEGESVAVVDRVVRRVQHEGESGSSSSREFVNLFVKGGADAKALAGVNVYLNNDWVGTTGTNGRAEITIRTGKSYNLMLYRHGYQQLAEKIRTEKTAESKEYAMAANTAVFNIESTPSNATVFVDGEEIGRTPLAGKSVDLGFHTLRLTVGESYRDWEEVVEFNKKIHDLTGERKIVLYKDYMKLGEAAEAKGNIDAAIAAYAATVKGHPDYSSAHHRLAQLYLDEKDDYDGAIREFENVLSLPENEQLVFKQYAIAYTNLGHAYYGRGDAAMNSDRNAAAQYFGKAIQNLKIAKQNTRFFPKAEYDEAVHDTYFYMALSYQKLYMLTKRSNLQNDANLAWRDYFDFYPASLVGKPMFEKNRETGKKFWDQVKEN